MAGEWVQWTYCRIIDLGTCRIVDPTGRGSTDPVYVLGEAGTTDDAYVVMEGADPRIRVQFEPWVEGIPPGVSNVKVGFRYVARLATPGPSGLSADPSFDGYHAGEPYYTFDHSRPPLPPTGELVAYDDVTYSSTTAVSTWEFVQAGTWQMEVRNTSDGVVWLSLLQYGGRAGSPQRVAPLRVLQRGSDGLGITGGRRVVGAKTIQASNRASGIR